MENRKNSKTAGQIWQSKQNRPWQSKQNGIKTVFGRRIRKDAQSGLVVRMDKHPLWNSTIFWFMGILVVELIQFVHARQFVKRFPCVVLFLISVPPDTVFHFPPASSWINDSFHIIFNVFQIIFWSRLVLRLRSCVKGFQKGGVYDIMKSVIRRNIELICMSWNHFCDGEWS